MKKSSVCIATICLSSFIDYVTSLAPDFSVSSLSQFKIHMIFFRKCVRCSNETVEGGVMMIE